MGCLPFKLTNGGPFSLGYNGGSNGSEAGGEGTGAANGGGGGGVAPRLLSFTRGKNKVGYRFRCEYKKIQCSADLT